MYIIFILFYMRCKILLNHIILVWGRLPPHVQNIFSCSLGNSTSLFFLSGSTVISFPNNRKEKEGLALA